MYMLVNTAVSRVSTLYAVSAMTILVNSAVSRVCAANAVLTVSIVSKVHLNSNVI